MDAVEEIKSRLSIEDVVSDYVELKRAGRNLKGLSPFQSEKTPSFIVSPEKQIWHDFSSNKGGNMFSFIMEMEGVEFRDALEILARKSGVELETYGRGRSQSKLKSRLSEALDLATKYFQQNLVKNPGALEYLITNRRLTKEAIMDFRIGYAPISDNGLVLALKKRDFSDDELIKAGLAVRRYRGLGDMFRGRIILPLMDQMGAIVGFTARQLVDDSNSPKYINTSQTLLYDKSRHIYGLSQAKDAIRTSGYVVVVEGNFDVVSSHQSGIRQCVATAGTAITESHLKALSRQAVDIRLCFDKDEAGIRATERAIGLAQGLGIKLSIIDTGEAKDPDELIKKDSVAWQNVVSEHIYAMDWLVNYYSRQNDISSANGKRQFTDNILRIIDGLSDKVEQEHYLKKVSELTNVSFEAINSKYSQFRQQPSKKIKLKKPNDSIEKPINDQMAYQDQLLGILLLYPLTRRVFETIDFDPIFSSPERQYVFEFITTNPQHTFSSDVPKDLQSIKDYVNILLLKAEELYQDLDANERFIEVNDLVRRLQKDYKQQKQSQITQLIRSAEEIGDDERVQQLLTTFKDLLKE